MSLGCGDRVALVGRNGVGKSTLLQLLSGRARPDAGRVLLRTQPHLVEQSLLPALRCGECQDILDWLLGNCSSPELARELRQAGLRPVGQMLEQNGPSHGELRKLQLLVAKLKGPEMLLLDEPTEDLDQAGIAWLRAWLRHRSGGLLVATHDVTLLQDFQDFFVIAEDGCRHFSGTYYELEVQLEKEHQAGEERYLRNLHRMVAQEEHTLHVARRRARKRQYGRVSELDRATPRATLNQKRDYAQVKHGKMKRNREAKLAALRDWTKATRRALKVELPLLLEAPSLSNSSIGPIVSLKGVSVDLGGRKLLRNLSFELKHERLAITGSNGTGKTTLLQVMLGQKAPSEGTAQSVQSRIGSIAQGGSDWMLGESLLTLLGGGGELVVAHKFPLALAQRPLHSLSPGERVRAALICLFQRPGVELLVLDEPTYSLDILGQRALTQALRAWPGGLVVVSHQPQFLEAIGIERYLELGGA